ncbi:hypothetical protein P4O66_004229 [Electrophorus voltai]|uniref:Alkylated DNA repair protein AlkB homologue 8 N-terminal domain-containing protein n=1 Tax=Electrophorus voltai TaxID=2609070 RepID=A0AAD9E2B7_9TELE|nr:hypothetical protein P4O66_004229 [Electrophorus voltai]
MSSSLPREGESWHTAVCARHLGLKRPAALRHDLHAATGWLCAGRQEGVFDAAGDRMLHFEWTGKWVTQRAFVSRQGIAFCLDCCEDVCRKHFQSPDSAAQILASVTGIISPNLDLSWSRHTSSLAKKARQRLYHLRRLRDFRLPSKVLRNFYTCTIESILTGNITVWFGNSTKQDRQALQRVVRSAERITHTELPDLQTIYYKRCQTKARKIVKDPTYPNNRLFSLLRRSSGLATIQLLPSVVAYLIRYPEREQFS